MHSAAALFVFLHLFISHFYAIIIQKNCKNISTLAAHFFHGHLNVCALLSETNFRLNLPIQISKVIERPFYKKKYYEKKKIEQSLHNTN